MEKKSLSALIGQILAGGRPVRINGAEISQREEKVQVLLFHALIFPSPPGKSLRKLSSLPRRHQSAARSLTGNTQRGNAGVCERYRCSTTHVSHSSSCRLTRRRRDTEAGEWVMETH